MTSTLKMKQLEEDIEEIDLQNNQSPDLMKNQKMNNTSSMIAKMGQTQTTMYGGMRSKNEP